MEAKLKLRKFKVIKHNEIAIDPSEAQALHRPSTIRTVPEIYGFLISV